MPSNELNLESNVHVENFMRANGVTVSKYDASQFGFCIIEPNTSKVRGQLAVNLSLTRREAIDLLKGLGVPVLNKEAG